MTRIFLPSSTEIERFSATGSAVYGVRAAERVMAIYGYCSKARRIVMPVADNRVIGSVVAVKKMIAVFPLVQIPLLEEVKNASQDLFQLECEILRGLEGNVSGEEGFELAAAGAAVSAAESAAKMALAIAESLANPGIPELMGAASRLAYEASSYAVEAANYADPSSVDPLIQLFIRDAGILQKGQEEGLKLTFDDLPPLWVTYTPAWLR